MLRRDYILEQIEQFAAALARILGNARDERWQEATTEASGEYQRLIGVDAATALAMSDTSLLAQVIQSASGNSVESHLFMLATLFKTSGDLLAAQEKFEAAWEYYLKGLNLLLDNAGATAVAQRPDFVPNIDAFLISLKEAELPVGTLVRLMRHFEQEGQFAKAEDALFAMAEAEPPSHELLDLGVNFYQRVLGHTDIELADGNLTREEVKTGLNDFQSRMNDNISREDS